MWKREPSFNSQGNDFMPKREKVGMKLEKEEWNFLPLKNTRFKSKPTNNKNDHIAKPIMKMMI